jgi:pyruvate/2-oxoglutarate dehydrogenase complex dihydrolipoamide acyltransferase (E2) component
MSVDILMPELGESVHEGTVTRWMKQVGDFVKEDEPVVEIMTDKVNQELQAPASGILVKIIIPEGGNVEVFSAMGVIEPDEDAARKMIADGGGSEVTAIPASEEPIAQVPAAPVEPTPEQAEPVSGEKRFFTPLVKAMAREAGITDGQLASIPGTGSDGRVTRKDVEAYLAKRGVTPTKPEAPKPSAPAASLEIKPAPAPVTAGPDQELIPLVGMRKMIADAMVRAAAIPTVSTLTEVDVTSMVEFRSRNKESFAEMYGVKFTYTPFFIKAIAETLAGFPMINASLTPDGKILVNKGVHMGCAVSLGKDGSGGLIVPVIKNCHGKTVIEIAKDLEGIAAKARANQLGVEDVQGGTFTLTNPGSYGAILGTPMINAPQSGILGVYGIVERPVVINKMIAIRSIMNIVLTYDHRLVDGLTAGKFLQALKAKLEAFDFFR